MAGQNYRAGKKKSSLPYSVLEPQVRRGIFFRRRLFLCSFLFIVFILIDSTVSITKEKQIFYQVLAQPMNETTIETWNQSLHSLEKLIK